MELLNLIQLSKGGDNSATLQLVEKFNPLLKKYAFKLSYEDAYNDLLLDFLILLNEINIPHIQQKHDAGIVNYICVCVRNSYIKKIQSLQQQKHIISFSALGESAEYILDSTFYAEIPYAKIEFSLMKEVLTEKEWNIIFALFDCGYTPTELAKKIGISRKTLYKRRNNALKKLRHFLFNNTSDQ